MSTLARRRQLDLLLLEIPRDHLLSNIRRYLEPGPIVLVSSAWQGETNIMTIGWHMMMHSIAACSDATSGTAIAASR